MDWELIISALALLVPLKWLVRQVHDGLQELFLLLTGHETAAIYLFQVLLLPGVLLHEFSHWLAAQALAVRVRKFSLRLKVVGRRIQMGAVVLDKPDFVRGLLIGLAPLVFGSIAVAWIGHHFFDVGTVIAAAEASDVQGTVRAVGAAFAVNDAWIWLYLVFAISNAMLPSESDREAVWLMAAFVGLVLVIAFLAGWGPAVVSKLAEPVETALGLLLVAFSITVFVDVVFLAIIWVLRTSTTLLTRRRLGREV